MYLGLYSRIAHAAIQKARAAIAEGRYAADTKGMKDFRRTSPQLLEKADLNSLMACADYYYLNMYRDLLFHVQEHQMSLPEIKAFLASHALQFLGFELDPRTLQQFRARYTSREALVDLDLWQSFEIEFPDTFHGMYEFAVQRMSGEPKST